MGKPTIYRQTISVSYDLKRRMDKVANQVNWSAIASRAFEEKLAEFSANKGMKNMSDVLQRLRASKIKSEDANYVEGKAAGETWAKESAEVEELRRLEELQRSARDWEEWFESGEGNAFSSGERLAGVLLGVQDLSRHLTSGFWETVLGDDTDKAYDDSFARGFADGAIGIWGEVKDKL